MLHTKRQIKTNRTRGRRKSQNTSSGYEAPEAPSATPTSGSNGHNDTNLIQVQAVHPFHESPAMGSYMNAMKQLTKGESKRQQTNGSNSKEPQDIKLKPGQVYAVLANDDPNYYFTVMLQPNQFTNGFSVHKSFPPTYGVVPDGIPVVSQFALNRQQREMDAFSSLEAFPFRGKEMEL